MCGLGWGIFEEGFGDGFKIGFTDSFIDEFHRAHVEVLSEDVDEDAKQKVRELAEQRCQKTMESKKFEDLLAESIEKLRREHPDSPFRNLYNE